MYEEYLNNIYLQYYVNNVIQADGALIALLVVASTLGIAFGLLKILRSTHRQLGALANQSLSPKAALTPASPSSSTSYSTPKPSMDLHPMVAALKADLAHQSSMEPLPPMEVKDAQSTPVQAPSAPPAPLPQVPTRSLVVVPPTVVTGTMPVLKRVNTDQDKNRSQQ